MFGAYYTTKMLTSRHTAAAPTRRSRLRLHRGRRFPPSSRARFPCAPRSTSHLLRCTVPFPSIRRRTADGRGAASSQDGRANDWDGVFRSGRLRGLKCPVLLLAAHKYPLNPCTIGWAAGAPPRARSWCTAVNQRPATIGLSNCQVVTASGKGKHSMATASNRGKQQKSSCQ